MFWFRIVAGRRPEPGTTFGVAFPGSRYRRSADDPGAVRGYCWAASRFSGKVILGQPATRRTLDDGYNVFLRPGFRQAFLWFQSVLHIVFYKKHEREWVLSENEMARFGDMGCDTGNEMPSPLSDLFSHAKQRENCRREKQQWISRWAMGDGRHTGSVDRPCLLPRAISRPDAVPWRHAAVRAPRGHPCNIMGRCGSFQIRPAGVSHG